jgi:branched-chain amino acid transport system permease protein
VILAVTNFPNGGGGFLGFISAGNLESIKNVRRPAIASGDIAYFRYVVIVCAVMFGLALLHVAAKPGRAWAAIRESEPAALAAGVNVTFYKLWAFGLAAFMTGCAGALLAAEQGQPTAYSFSTQDSLTAVATALIGGIYSFWGAIVAGIFYSLAPFLIKDQWGLDNNLLIALFGVGLLQVLLTAPGGIADQLPRDLKTLSRKAWGLGKRAARRDSNAAA